MLVGSISVEVSEHLAQRLTRAGIPHNVLNAKEHERESEIIKDAGVPGAVTIATNMAGRGVDIKLGEGVRELGGLYVLGTERHEARRIDNQLRGRSGRQGDPGESRFYLSGQDDLVRLFAGDRIHGIMERFGVPDDQPMESGILSKQVENAQKKVEEQNFVSRKNILKYDDVLNVQREVIYGQRRKVLEGQDLSEEIGTWIDEVIEAIVIQHEPVEVGEDWDLDSLVQVMTDLYGTEITADELREEGVHAGVEELTNYFREDAHEEYKLKEDDVTAEVMRDVERYVVLQVVDTRWREHLENMDYLREGVHLRAFAQKDPLVEYRAEGHKMFEELGNDHPRGSRDAPLPRADRGRGSRRSDARRRPERATARLRARVARRSRRDHGRGRRRRRDGRASSAAAEAQSPRSSVSSPTRRRSAATTRAGAGAARSSRSATAPERRLARYRCRSRC